MILTIEIRKDIKMMKEALDELDPFINHPSCIYSDDPFTLMLNTRFNYLDERIKWAG